MSLTWLLMAVWRIRQTINRQRFNLALLAQDINRRAAVAGKVAGIAVTAILWGVGAYV